MAKWLWAEMLADARRAARESDFDIGTVTQGKPSVNRANPGLNASTPLVSSEDVRRAVWNSLVEDQVDFRVSLRRLLQSSM